MRNTPSVSSYQDTHHDALMQGVVMVSVTGCVVGCRGSFRGSWIRKNSDTSLFLSFCKLSYVTPKHFRFLQKRFKIPPGVANNWVMVPGEAARRLLLTGQTESWVRDVRGDEP
jgi:hypothetical protein